MMKNADYMGKKISKSIKFAINKHLRKVFLKVFCPLSRIGSLTNIPHNDTIDFTKWFRQWSWSSEK